MPKKEAETKKNKSTSAFPKRGVKKTSKSDSADKLVGRNAKPAKKNSGMGETPARIIGGNKGRIRKRTVTEKAPGGEKVRQEKKYFVSWTGMDFARTQEETLFYKASSVASVLVMFWAARDGNWVTFITFLMLFAVIVFELQAKPKNIDCEISIDGILIDGRLYKFDDIRSFEMLEKGGQEIVRLHLRGVILPMKDLYLDERHDVPLIRGALEYFLPYESREETILDFKGGRKELSEDEFINEKVDEYLKGKF